MPLYQKMASSTCPWCLAPEVAAIVKRASLDALKECGARGGASIVDDHLSLDARTPKAISMHVRRGDACMRWAERGDAEYATGKGRAGAS